MQQPQEYKEILLLPCHLLLLLLQLLLLILLQLLLCSRKFKSSLKKNVLNFLGNQSAFFPFNFPLLIH
jgi:hypothetical protein